MLPVYCPFGKTKVACFNKNMVRYASHLTKINISISQQNIGKISIFIIISSNIASLSCKLLMVSLIYKKGLDSH